MVYWWQHFLSARPSRTNVAYKPTSESHEGAIKYEFVEEMDGRHTIQETHYIDRPIVREGKSGPPLHIHLHQLESFQVSQGVLGIVRNGKEIALTKDDGVVSVAPGVRHTFWPHSTSTENVIFKCWVQPENVDYGLDESFLRNFSSYFSDCERAKMAPSIFQILLFLYDADIVLTPPFYMPIFVLKGLHHLFAYWIAKGILGYREFYPEYSQRTMSKKAK